MSDEIKMAAKATEPKEASDAIVVSFGAEWHQPLLDRKFSAVIRKRVPRTVTAKWLYFHVNTPVGGICARAKIASVSELSLKEASGLSAQLALSPDEIRAYIGGDDKIGCYKLGRITLLRKTLTTGELATKLVYHPPQSFFILSRSAKQVIDKLAGF